MTSEAFLGRRSRLSAPVNPRIFLSRADFHPEPQPQHFRQLDHGHVPESHWTIACFGPTSVTLIHDGSPQSAVSGGSLVYSCVAPCLRQATLYKSSLALPTGDTTRHHVNGEAILVDTCRTFDGRMFSISEARRRKPFTRSKSQPFGLHR